jgi:cytochrome bd-type quinol oxidase subunit 2
MPDLLSAIMRWLHISSMAALLGGFLYARLAMTPASRALAPDGNEALGERAAAAFRPLAFAAMAGTLISGFYNILTSPGHSARYHMLLGIKLLLVAHLFVATILIVRPHCQRRPRLMTSAFLSGLAIVLIAAYMRRIF